MKKIFFITLLLIIIAPNVEAETIEEQISSLNSDANSINNAVNNLNNINSLYPVGSIYITTSNTNPSSTLGGTWEAYASGRKLIGVGSNGTTNYTYNATGGSSTKTIAVANMAKHTHTITPKGSISNTFTGTAATSSSSGGHSHTVPWHSTSSEASGYGLVRGAAAFQNRVIVTNGSITSSSAGSHSHSLTASGTVTSSFSGTAANTSYTGSGTAFSIQNPYITVYMWKRIA